MKVLLSYFLAAFVFFSTPALASDEKKTDTASGLSIAHIWGKPNYGPNGAAYFTLKNNSEKTRHLIGASSALSDRVELHTHIHVDGIMKMRQMKDGIIIKPGETVHFKPAGNHVMLMSMKAKLKPGSSYDLQLKFKDGATETIKVTIKANAHEKEHRGSHGDDARGSHSNKKPCHSNKDKRGSHEDGKPCHCNKDKHGSHKGSKPCHCNKDKRGSHEGSKPCHCNKDKRGSHEGSKPCHCNKDKRGSHEDKEK